MAVEFGIHLGLNTVGDPAPDRLAYYRRCLEIGADALKALWLSDHLQNGDAPVFEGWTTLSYVAALAPSYRVGNMVLGQSYYDYPFPRAGERVEQLSEAIDVIRAMWTKAPASYKGKHYAVRGAYCEPRPSPPPPILIGGQGPKLMRVAAAKANAWVWDGPLEMYQPPHRRLVDSCAQVGRPISEIERLVAIGVEDFCVFFYDLTTLRRFVDEVVPQSADW